MSVGSETSLRGQQAPNQAVGSRQRFGSARYQSSGGRERKGEVGEGVLLARRNPARLSISALHTERARTKQQASPPPQHSTEVSPQQHDADHEALLSLGCALICWQSLRETWMTG